METSQPNSLKVPEAAAYANTSTYEIRKAIRDGKLPVVGFGRTIRVPRAALDRALGRVEVDRALGRKS